MIFSSQKEVHIKEIKDLQRGQVHKTVMMRKWSA
jgi:hypothetical protein